MTILRTLVKAESNSLGNILSSENVGQVRFGGGGFAWAARPGRETKFR